MASSSGSLHRRWAAASGSAGSGAPRSGLAASSHSVMALNRRGEMSKRILMAEVLCFNATWAHTLPWYSFIRAVQCRMLQIRFVAEYSK